MQGLASHAAEAISDQVHRAVLASALDAPGAGFGPEHVECAGGPSPFRFRVLFPLLPVGRGRGAANALLAPANWVGGVGVCPAPPVGWVLAGCWLAVGRGVGRERDDLRAMAFGLDDPACSMREVRPSCTTLILPAANRRAMASAKSRFLSPWLPWPRARSANTLGA